MFDSIRSCKVFFYQIDNIKKYYKSLFKQGAGSTKHEIYFTEKHGWNAVISDLTGGDIARVDEIMNRKIHEVFTELEIRKDRVEMERKVHDEKKHGNNITTI